MPSTRTNYLRISAAPVVALAVLCLAAAAYALAAHPAAATVRATLAGVTVGVGLMLIASLAAASAANRRVTDHVNAARVLAQRGEVEVQQLAERLLRGERIAPLGPAPAHIPGDDDLFRLLARDLEQSHYAAGRAVQRVADRAAPGGRADHQVQIFVNMARRMQSLVHREIELLDDLEAQVEDPDLLKGLFTVDHLATRMRRQSESLAVLGGSASRRQWTRQVTMHEVLRAAIAEVEQYSRVKVVPPVEGVIRGGAVSDVIHLIAELVENATKFSPPRTTVLLRAQKVTAGVAIDVEDRGLGILQADKQRMNALLTDPGKIDIDELLRDGRIGLFVVSTLARRHNVHVQLENNIYGGTQAVVVLPATLLEDGDREPQRGEWGEDRQHEPGLAVAQAAMSGGQAALPAFTAERLPLPADRAPLTAEPPPLTAEHAPLTAERPPLPRRQVQASLARQLRDQRADNPAGDAPESPAEQTPGLMADFLRGISRSEDEEFPAWDARD